MVKIGHISDFLLLVVFLPRTSASDDGTDYNEIWIGIVATLIPAIIIFVVGYIIVHFFTEPCAKFCKGRCLLKHCCRAKQDEIEEKEKQEFEKKEKLERQKREEERQKREEERQKHEEERHKREEEREKKAELERRKQDEERQRNKEVELEKIRLEMSLHKMGTKLSEFENNQKQREEAEKKRKEEKKRLEKEGAEIKGKAIVLKKCLEDIAKDLGRHSGNVKKATLFGGALAVIAGVGGIAFAIGAAVLTAGGAIVPLIIAGGVGVSAVGGGGTVVGANIVGKVIEKSKLEDAESIWIDFCKSYVIKYGIPIVTASFKDAQIALIQYLLGKTNTHEVLKHFNNATVNYTHENEEIRLTGAILSQFNAFGLICLVMAQKKCHSPSGLLKQFVNKVIDPVIERGY